MNLSLHALVVLIIYLHITSASSNNLYLSGQCSDRFIPCHHVCIQNPDNLQQFYCTCRSGYYVQGDGFSCKKTPPKDLEMNIEINHGSFDDKTEPSKPTPKKSTKVLLTRVRRSTRHKSKTPKPIQALQKGKCTSTSCKNGGLCQTMKSSSSNDYVIFCLCRLGFDGLSCERTTPGVRFPKFTSNGYLAFPERILNEQEFRMSVYVKPAILMAGTLVAFKNSELSNHFLLGIEKNKFVFRFESKNSRKEIRHQTPVVSTNDRWYKVEIERKDNVGRLFVDDIESTLSPMELPKDTGAKYPSITDKTDEVASNFICDFCLYLGGHPQLSVNVKKNHNLFGQIESTYIGCMRNLVIDEIDIDMRRMPFYGRAVEGLGIEDCSAGLCESIKCQNKGECQVSTDYQPTCQCTLGFTGRFCNKVTIIKMPSFTGDSYASYTGLRGTSRSENRIFIRFKPYSDTGILLYQGYSNDKRGDFLSVYLINGYPCVSYDLGSGTISLRSKRSINLREWHTVRFNRIGRQGTLSVNDDDVITGNSPGAQVQLTITQNLLLGGVDSVDNVSAFLSIKNGFKGCVQMLFIDNQHVNLTGEIEKSRNIENCNSHTCGDAKRICWKDGECIPDHDNFVCSCPLGYIEANCQTQIQITAIRDPSFNASSYLVYTNDRIVKKLSESKFNFSMFLNLRLMQSNRILLHATRTSPLGVDHTFSLKINARNGIDFVLSNGDETVSRSLLNNMPILSDHKIQILKDRNTIQFTMNDTLVSTVKLKYNTLSTIGFSKLFLGGTDLSTAILMNMPVQSGIVGCIKNINLDSQPILVKDTDDGRSVADCGSLKS